MSMNDKYYTPDIEEFHLGFEYLLEEEFLDEEGCAYYEEREKVFSVGDTITFNRCVRVNDYSLYHISVKYLDKEDIESFGFKEDTYDINHFKFILAYCNDVKINNFECYNINKYQNLFFDNSNNAIYNVIITTTIGEKNIPKFIGTIKNKSELKQILKTIGHDSK